MNEQPVMRLKAIGIVKNGIQQPVKEGWEEIVSEIIIDSCLTRALENLEEFSHILVLYWLHQSPENVSCKVKPRGRKEAPLIGLFASRSPNRINPIGVMTVKLLERNENILRVKGLDAIDGTPVLDIKPYIPGYDSVNNARVPPWISQI